MSRTDNADAQPPMQPIQFLAKPCPRKLSFSTFRYLKLNLTELTELKILFSISSKA